MNYLRFSLFLSFFSLYVTTDEPDYWWFELAILLNKTMMCGGLVVLNPGSPTQVVCAILIMQFHLLLVLKSAPYVSSSEDWSSFASSLGLTLTYVGALLKMLQVEVRHRSEASADELYYADAAMNCLPIACVAIVVLIMIFVECGILKYMRGKKKKQNDGNESNGSLTQVLPIVGPGDEAVQNNEKKKKKNDGDIKSWGTKPQSKPISTVVGTNSSLAITVMMLVGSFVVGGAEGQSVGSTYSLVLDRKSIRKQLLQHK